MPRPPPQQHRPPRSARGVTAACYHERWMRRRWRGVVPGTPSMGSHCRAPIRTRAPGAAGVSKGPDRVCMRTPSRGEVLSGPAHTSTPLHCHISTSQHPPLYLRCGSVAQGTRVTSSTSESEQECRLKIASRSRAASGSGGTPPARLFEDGYCNLLRLDATASPQQTIHFYLLRSVKWCRRDARRDAGVTQA